MKIKDLKNTLVPLNLMDREFKIAFDFNAICELDEVYGEFDKAIKAMNEGKGKYKAVRALVYSSIKPRYDVTLIEVGEMLTEVLNSEEKAEYLMNQIMSAIELSMPNEKDEQGE